MKWIWLFIVMATTLGCGHSSTKEDDGVRFAKQQKMANEFEVANQMFDAGKSSEAAQAYDKILLEDPPPDFQRMIAYNAGLAYLQAADCPRAGERLRQVVRSAHQKTPELEGRALLRMGDVYTCLGQENKSIATFLQLSRGKFNLPPDVTDTEVPAKLAGSYARIGNIREAERYFHIAEKGLNKMEDSLREAQRRDELARILFQMGNINQISTRTMKSEEYFSTIRALQKYLLRSVELDSKMWSPQSRDVIVQAYRQIWDYVDAIQPAKNEDAAIASRQQKLTQLNLAEEAIQSLRALRNEHIPNPNDPEVVIGLMNRLHGEEMRLKNYIAVNIVGTNLTPEAISAQSLRRMGRVLNPDPILENITLRPARPPVNTRRSRSAVQAPEEE